VYRYYPVGPNTVDGVTVTFHYAGTPTDPRSESEPLLLVGRIQYSSLTGADPPDAATSKGRCAEWDLWYLYFEWGEDRETNKVLSRGLADNGRVAWARLIAVPLFTVDNIEAVVRLSDEVIGCSPDRSTATPIA
jgi:hypothetical protein